MTNIASTLLDFLLNLFRDPEAAREYAEDPRGALDAAGLYDVEPEDVAALRPAVEDSSPGAYGCNDVSESTYAPVRRDDDRHDGQGSGGHEVAAITHVKHVENNYSTDVDVEIDAKNSVWAGGDAIAIWGDDVVLATGGSIAAGEEIEDAEIDNSVEIEDAFNDNSTNSHNTGTNIADRGGEVEDNDTTVEVEDSFNGATLAGGDVDQSTELEIEESFNGNTVAGRDVVETEIDIEDSQVAGRDVNEIDVEVEDSFNPEDNSVTVDDITLTEDNSTDVDIEESFNDNALAFDEAIANSGEVEVDVDA